MTRSKGNADHLARRRIDGDDFFIVCIEHITLIQTPCENGIVHADAELRSVVGRLFMNLFEGFMPFDIDVFDRFSGSVKFRKSVRKPLKKVPPYRITRSEAAS